MFNQIPLIEITKHLDYHSFQQFRIVSKDIYNRTCDEEVIWKVKAFIAATKIKRAWKLNKKRKERCRRSNNDSVGYGRGWGGSLFQLVSYGVQDRYLSMT